ncbi:hypothetical protein ACVWXL_004184 [Bradyrhizobium sp. GM22.5]
MDSLSIVTCSDRRLVSACWNASKRFTLWSWSCTTWELVNRFLLGCLQPLGLLDQLLGCLCGASLQLPRRHHPVGLRGRAGIGTPDRDRGHPRDQEQERGGGQRDRLGAKAKEGMGPCVLCEIDHR